MIVYKTTNLINFKSYVGKDSNENEKYFGSGLKLIRAINKYGKENFRKDILEFCSSIEELNKQEKFWIKLLKTQDPKYGYNIADGGDGGDTLSQLKYQDEEKYNKICKKISKRNIGKHIGNFHSEETKEKLRQIKLGKKLYPHSKETKLKMSNVAKLAFKNGLRDLSGINNPMYGKTGINSPIYGIKRSEETKEKQRQNNLGKNNPMYGKIQSEKDKKIKSIKCKLFYAKKRNNIEQINQLEKEYNNVRAS